MTKKLIDLAIATDSRYPWEASYGRLYCGGVPIGIMEDSRDTAFIAAADPAKIIELCEAAEAVLGVWEGEPLSPELQRLRKALEVDALEGRHDHC